MPTGSGCFGVEAVDSGRFGVFKPVAIAQEKICSDLARAVGVKVPDVQLGTLEGTGMKGAVSFAHTSAAFDRWLPK